MSAPTTPAEMADWLRDSLSDELPSDDYRVADAILAWLRRQPTDAQKIEALQLASDAGEVGSYAEQTWFTETLRESPNPYMLHRVHGLAVWSATRARQAMRLLGLPTD